MSLNCNPELVRRTIDLNYAKRKRSHSLKWSLVNAVFLAVFAYDLSCKCPGYTSALHYVEYAVAGVLGANLLQHALQLLPRRQTPLPLTAQQRNLLGLSQADLDSSFRLVEDSSPGGSRVEADSDSDVDAFSASFSSARRSFRSHSESPPASSSSPSHSPPTPHDSFKDRFIADRQSLSDYLKHYESKRRDDAARAGPEAFQTPRLQPHYQLACADSDGGAAEEGTAGAAAWRRLRLDPRRATQWNLNLRLWLHVTILARLERELAAADATLARLGMAERVESVPAERLRAVPALRALPPFLGEFPDRAYVVRRIRELARGGCLSAYRWSGGGAGWDDSRPTDAELLLHLLAAYLDAQLPPPGFSAEHVSAAPAQPPRHARALALHRLSRRPPHYALALGEETLEVARGRNNLLHTLLLFLAAAAARDPPALRRVHLGPAGLNMLWIIDR